MLVEEPTSNLELTHVDRVLEMADEFLLAGQRAHSARLLATGYEFRFLDLEGALRHLLGR